MTPSSDAPPKIAIKGFSLSSSAKPKAGANGNSSTNPNSNGRNRGPPPSSLGKRSRNGGILAHGDDESGSSDDEGAFGNRKNGSSRPKGRVQAVNSFGDEGAVHDDHTGRKTGGPLVIPKLANRDWKGEARGRRIAGGGKNLLPPEVQAEREAMRREKEGRGREEGKEEGVDVVNSRDGEIEWGLSVRKKVRVDEDTAIMEQTTTEAVEVVKEDKVNEDKPRTVEDEALAALLGHSTKPSGPDLIIASTKNTSTPPQPLSETDAYRHAIATAPPPSTLSDYDAIPVEEFGAAMLRGMGWKGESHSVTKGKEVKRRQNLLGLGARELKEAEELGAWVQKSDVKRLNPGSGAGGKGGSGSGGYGGGRGERKPKASEYRREEERRREERESRGGGSYRRERDRDRDGYRSSRR